MIQFNLLPDVKLAYIKSTKLKRLVTTISALVAAGFIAVLIITFVLVDVVQRSHLHSLTSNIQSDINKLKGTQNLSQVLTIQNQISALSGLHAKEPVASRLFNDLQQTVPASATLSDFNINYSTNLMTLTGAADTLTTVNKFVDTLKFSTYISGSATTMGQKAYSNVVLTSFGYSSANGANFIISTTFDPNIFSDANSVTLTVPNLITTRSVLDQPKILFQPQPANPNNSSSTSNTGSTQ